MVERRKKTYCDALELAGMELIFFIAACMVLCSKIGTTAVLVVLSQHLGFLCISLCPHSEQAGDRWAADRSSPKG